MRKLWNKFTKYLDDQVLGSQIHEASDFFDNQEYDKAAVKLQNILDFGIKDQAVFKIAVGTYIMTKNYKAGLAVHQNFVKSLPLDTEDYYFGGLIKMNLEKYEEAMLDFNKSLELNPMNKSTLRKRGYIHIIFKENQKAIFDFDKAIELDPDDCYSYSNRGLAKIYLGNEPEGLDDINHAIKIDQSESDLSYAYRNLGIYFFNKGDFQNARIKFDKANEIDSETHMLSDYIVQTKNKIKEQSE